MGVQTKTGKIVAEYINKNPDLPSKQIARMVYADHPAQFTDIEHIRSIVRYYRDAMGKADRGKKKSVAVKQRTILPLMPTEESEDQKPLVLKKENNNIGVISDLHIPNHRNTPLALSLDRFTIMGVNTILINGDLLDNTPFSRFDKVPPSFGDVRRYFDKAELFLENLRANFKNARIIWLEGNHDHWYMKYLMKKAPELYGDPYYELTYRLNLDDHKIEFLPQERYLMAGKLAVAHGHHIVKGLFAPVNAARGVFLRTKKSCLIGHVHVTSQHTETDLHGDLIGTWSTGCLCTLTPDYQPMAGKANHGFAHVAVHENGEFTVTNYHIHKGKLL